MAEAYCGSEPCPLFLNSTCVFYTGESLLYIGVQTNDTLEAIIVKINQAFQNTGIGYAFTNGVIQPTPSQPVQLGGALIQNTTIGGNFTLTFSGNVQAAKHITTGGSSSQFVKGDGTLDSTAYQPAANYITGLSGDVLASGPGVAAATLATVNFSSGTFGNGNTIPIVTVNSKGLVTNITPTPINLPPISLTFIGDVVGSGLTGSNITLLLQNVNPNPYNTITPLKFSVNGKGLVTSASPITASDIVNILGFNPSGTAGSSGTSGTTGTSGTSGVNGTSGIDGTFGTSGTSGTSGSSATSGTSGTSGSSGTAGTSGSTGTSGSSGTTGTSGSSGTTGTSGSSGTSGTTGTSGSSGTSGTTGTSGSSGLSGDRFKTTSTTTYTLQAPGNPGTLTVDPGLSYTVAQSIIIAYDANNHNEAEVTSYNSITGVINFVTFTLTGLGTYSNWFVNIDGASGGDGSSGSSGTTGTSGSSGTSGTTGTSGSSGTSGTTGTSGSSGTSGTSATDGTGGTSGTSGSSATSGTTGTSGTSATSGTSGTSGTSVAVSGTTNTLAKFTSSTTIGNSLFTDDGTNGAFGGANYSTGTSVRTFNISAPLYAGIGFWANNVYTGDIFSYTVSGNLIIAADPTNILTDSRVILATDGTQRLAVFSDGNVSIANSPTNSGFKLYVASPSTAIAAFEGATNGYVDINDGTVNSRLQNTAQGFLIGTVNSYNLNLRTNNTIRLTIDGSTGAATFSGQINANAAETNSVNPVTSASVSIAGGYSGIRSAIDHSFNIDVYNSASPINALKITQTGAATFSSTLQTTHIGINNAPTLARLFATQTTDGEWIATFKNYGGSSSYGVSIDMSGSTSDQSALQVYTRTGNGLRLVNTGNLLVGNFTDNGARLQVVGTSFAFSVTGSNGAIAGTGLSYINNSDDAFALVLNNAGTSGQNDRGVFDVRRQGNSIFRINNSGNVGIDTNTPNGKLTIRAAASDIPSLVFKNEIGGPSSAISNYVSAAQTFTLFGTNVYVNSTANLSRFDTSKESSAILFDEGLFRVLTGTTGSNPSTRMSITSSGAASFTDSVTAQGFNTSVGTVSAPTSTWVTVYTIPSTQAAEGVYYAYGHYNDDSGGMAFIQVLADRTHLRAINGSNSSVQMQISGRNIQVLQVYGVTLSIQYSILWQKLR